MSRLEWHGDAWLATVPPAIDRAVTDAALVAQRAMQVNLSGASPSRPGSYPGMDQGRLRQSIFAAGPAQTGKPMTAHVGSNLRRSRLLEFGGWVHAKAGKFLTIPLTADAKLLRRRVSSLRQLPGMKVFRTKAGKLFLGGMATGSPGVKRKYRALFKLVPRVFVAARPWAMRSVRESAPEMMAAFKVSLARGLGKRGGVR